MSVVRTRRRGAGLKTSWMALRYGNSAEAGTASLLHSERRQQLRWGCLPER